MRSRHRGRRQARQLIKQRPDAVLKFCDHRLHKAPFYVFTWATGGSVRLEITTDGEIKFHSFGMRAERIPNYREIPPEEWPDPVCAWMAKRALTEGETR